MEAVQSILIDDLEEKFGLISFPLKNSVLQIKDFEVLKHLRKQIRAVESLEEFTGYVNKVQP